MDMFPSPTADKECSTCHRRLPLGSFHRRQHYVKRGVRAACKDCTREATKRARANGGRKLDRRKHRVRMRTRLALARGELVERPCSVCGHPDVQAHHPSYEGETAHLVVVFLCRRHHALEHGRRAWTQQMELFPGLA